MAMIAAIAIVLGLLLNPTNVGALSVVLGLLGLFAMLVAVLVACVDLSMGVRCPCCHKYAMVRVSLQSFRDRFYRCTSCDARCRRGFLKGWDDASDPEYEPIYTKKRAENPWTAVPGVEDEVGLMTKTHANLLANKNRRNPNQPDQFEGRQP
jgi:hypothetical protein